MLINGLKSNKGLDLRSPSTKFNLMRKLQEVKELNNSSDEETENHKVAGDNEDDVRYHPDHPFAQSQQALPPNITRSGIELRSVNDFSRLFINEEDEEDEDSCPEEIENT